MRSPSTLRVLKELHRLDFISSEHERLIYESYGFWRRIEQKNLFRCWRANAIKHKQERLAAEKLTAIRTDVIRGRADALEHEVSELKQRLEEEANAKIAAKAKEVERGCVRLHAVTHFVFSAVGGAGLAILHAKSRRAASFPSSNILPVK